MPATRRAGWRSSTRANTPSSTSSSANTANMPVTSWRWSRTTAPRRCAPIPNRPTRIDMSRQRASQRKPMPAAGPDAPPPDAVARARGIVEFLKGCADRIEAGRALPTDVVAALHEARLFRLLLPRSLGGDELHLGTLAQVTEVIGGADASTAWCLGQAAGCAMAAASLKPEVARRLFGPADAVLAWGAGIQGKAFAVDGGYRVNGTWTFASGCANA